MSVQGSVVLRLAREGDGAEMQRLVRDAYALYVDRIGREPEPLTLDHEQVAGSGRCVLAVASGSLVGLLVWSTETDELLIENVAVSPAVQRGGIGTLLLDHVEQIARDAGCVRMRLYTNEAMTENLDYYRRRGFTETHRAREHGFARVFFVKDLPASGS